MVVLLHEEQICDEQEQADAQQVAPVPEGRVRNENHPCANGQLQRHIDAGNHRMLHPQFIRHNLVSMFPMRFAQVLMQHDPVNNRKHRVNPIDRQKHDVGNVSCLQNKQPEQEENNKSSTDTSHIARKALRLALGPEVEEAEHQIRQNRNNNQTLVNEPDLRIQPGQRQQHSQRIAAVHAIDAIHEIVGIRNAHAENQAQNDDPPALPV